MSATLKPVDIFAERCGLTPQDCATVFGHAPWRENAYRVAIDCRVDTRLRCRSRYYETTARTVAQICRTRPGIPAAVFFSSFLYAENVMAYVEALFPELRIYLQPRGVELAAQTEFIQESLLLGDALFLVFGSSYAEGIDLLGGRVEDIMIVGPALPEANLVQRTRIEHHPAGPGRDAFRDVYIRPAMQRIHQALGRVVRAPEHRARVLLHGKRFAEAAFKEELAPDYRNAQLVRKDEELLGWLEAQKDG
jgi:Rad3-related DNA helicase